MAHQLPDGTVAPLPLHAVESSDLAAIGYDKDLEILDVKFRKTNRTKRYFNVGELIYTGLMDAKSKGGYFGRFIRSHYMCVDL